MCSDVVRGVVLSLISQKIADAPDRREVMERSLHQHADVLAAVRRRDGHQAARLARESLYDYYAGYVTDDERPLLRALLDEI